jgi:hypothetical protein
MKIQQRHAQLSLSCSLLIGAVALGGAGCGAPVDGREMQTDPAVAASNLQNIFFMGQWYDTTGDVHVVMWTSDWSNGNHNTAECAVPSGYVLVGGGAEIYSANSGALLHASYPDGTNQKWIAKSKDHGYSDYHAVSAWCIGLELKGLSATVLRQNTHYSNPVTSDTGHNVWVGAQVAGSDIIVGGGARANWTGPGMLLHQTEGVGGVGGVWYAGAKDHVYAEYGGSVSAYAIGITRCPSGWGGKCLSSHSLSFHGSPDGTGQQWFAASEDFPWALTNVGGLATYGGPGRLLTDVFPWNGGSGDGQGGGSVGTKDHIYADSGHSIVNFIGIKRD